MESTMRDKKEPSNKSEFDEYLGSSEKIEGRASPDLWPEEFPGISDFVEPVQTLQGWLSDWQREDVYKADELSRMHVGELLEHVRQLQNRAFQLGESEVRELARGKLMDVLGKKNGTK